MLSPIQSWVRLQEYFLRKRGFYKFSNKYFLFKVPGSDCARTSPHCPMLCHAIPITGQLKELSVLHGEVCSLETLCKVFRVQHAVLDTLAQCLESVRLVACRVVCSVQCAVSRECASGGGEGNGASWWSWHCSHPQPQSTDSCPQTEVRCCSATQLFTIQGSCSVSNRYSKTYLKVVTVSPPRKGTLLQNIKYTNLFVGSYRRTISSFWEFCPYHTNLRAIAMWNTGVMKWP